MIAIGTGILKVGHIEVVIDCGGARVELRLADETDYVVAFAVLAE